MPVKMHLIVDFMVEDSVEDYGALLASMKKALSEVPGVNSVWPGGVLEGHIHE